MRPNKVWLLAVCLLIDADWVVWEIGELVKELVDDLRMEVGCKFDDGNGLVVVMG